MFCKGCDVLKLDGNGGFDMAKGTNFILFFGRKMKNKEKKKC